jgi:hypothetical protein
MAVRVGSGTHMHAEGTLPPLNKVQVLCTFGEMICQAHLGLFMKE